MNNVPGRIKRPEPEASGNALPIIGYLSIGEKVFNAAGVNTHAKANDFFRVRGKNGEPCKYEAIFKEAFGDKPKVIPIAFISDDLKESCNQQYEYWEAGKRMGWGDGVTFHVWSVQAKDHVKVDANHKVVLEWFTPDAKGKTKWVEKLHLTFVIPKLSSVMGLFKFVTGGAKTTIPEITKAFDFIKAKAGTVQYFPFDLIVESNTGRTPGEAKAWKSVKLIPSFGQDSVKNIRQLYASGDMSKLQNAALFSMSEAEIKQIAMEAPAPKLEEVQYAEVIESKVTDTKPTVEIKIEPVAEETKPTEMQPNPRADEVGDIIKKAAETPVKTVTPSLSSVGKKTTPDDLFKEDK